MSGDGPGPLIYLIAGEPSGDALGGALMGALRDMGGQGIRFAGIGGARMTGQGLESLFPMADLSIMGLVEVLPRLPRLIGRLRQTVADIIRCRPAAVVTIDAPGFTLRVVRRLKGRGIPLVHYVAPTVWAWKPGRAARMARVLDHLLVLLPFEPPYFEAVGLGCTFVGHPIVEAEGGEGAAFRRRHGIDPAAPLLCLLPGSRRGETDRLLGVFGDALRRLHEQRPILRAVVSTIDAVAGPVRAAAAGWPGSPIIVEEGEKQDAFAAADVALAASGTVALELAMAGTPMVIAYRVNPLTAWLARRLIRVRFATLINIILDREAIPELLQQDCRAAALADAVGVLLDDRTAARTQVTLAAEALEQLGRGGEAPSRRAAREVLAVLERHAQQRKQIGGIDHARAARGS